MPRVPSKGRIESSMTAMGDGGELPTALHKPFWHICRVRWSGQAWGKVNQESLDSRSDL